jgi:hypothetical protein
MSTTDVNQLRPTHKFIPEFQIPYTTQSVQVKPMQQLIKSCLIQFLHEFSILIVHLTQLDLEGYAFPLATTEKNWQILSGEEYEGGNRKPAGECT